MWYNGIMIEKATNTAPQPDTARIERDARSLLKAKWSDLAIADHILLNNGEQTYGVYLTQASILDIIAPLIREMNSVIALEWATIRKSIKSL
tara:strand:+ start:438 stop:713 length:276 start_codon:yes stop_codon:yes gene_type:complete